MYNGRLPSRHLDSQASARDITLRACNGHGAQSFSAPETPFRATAGWHRLAVYEALFCTARKQKAGGICHALFPFTRMADPGICFSPQRIWARSICPTLSTTLVAASSTAGAAVLTAYPPKSRIMGRSLPSSPTTSTSPSQ